MLENRKFIEKVKEEIRNLQKEEEQIRDHNPIKSEQNKDDFPAWYTEEGRKAKAVQEGICKDCAHLWLIRDDRGNFEFKGVWCAIFKRKLEAKVESCPKFYALGDEIDRLIKQMGIK